MRQHHLADPRAIAGDELQHGMWNSRLMQQAHGFRGNQRRLLGGL